MALNTSPEGSRGIWDSIKGAMGLFGSDNKADDLIDGAEPELVDEYESSLTEEKILDLVSDYKKSYSVYYEPVKKTQDLAFDYWIGKHRDPYSTGLSTPNQANNQQVADNLIFEAIETFLPIATRANPEPLVTADKGEMGQKFASDIRNALVYFADTQLMRRKLAKGARSWLLNRLGAWRLSWNPRTKTIELEVENVKRMRFDPDGHINEKGEFTGDWYSIDRKLSAEDLIELFPKKKDVITKSVKDKMGTKVTWTEWQYCRTDVFYTLGDDTVLGKFKNPNWNYDGEEAVINSESGEKETVPVQGRNHLPEMSYPHRFLSIFSVSDQPHDNTSLVLQNIPQQDKINRLEVQIDKNIEGMNNGIVVSGEHFTEEQASQAAAALRRGVAIRVPSGKVNDAVLFPERPGLPADVFNNRNDARQQLKNVFGTAGSTAESIDKQDTVRGKIMVNQLDASRIGGGVTEYLEQVADALYNLYMQMMFVYYDEPHFINAAGSVGGMELITLKNTEFPHLSGLVISVKEGSLVPKDPLTQRNEAIDLWSSNAIDPLSLFKKLDFPDPEQATNQLLLWQMLQKGQIPPQAYLPNFAMAGQIPGQMGMPGQPMVPGMPQGEPQQPGTGGPAVSAVGPSQPGGITPQQPAPTQSQQLMQAEPIPKV